MSRERSLPEERQRRVGLSGPVRERRGQCAVDSALSGRWTAQTERRRRRSVAQRSPPPCPFEVRVCLCLPAGLQDAPPPRGWSTLPWLEGGASLWEVVVHENVTAALVPAGAQPEQQPEQQPELCAPWEMWAMQLASAPGAQEAMLPGHFEQMWLLKPVMTSHPITPAPPMVPLPPHMSFEPVSSPDPSDLVLQEVRRALLCKPTLPLDPLDPFDGVATSEPTVTLDPVVPLRPIALLTPFDPSDPLVLLAPAFGAPASSTARGTTMLHRWVSTLQLDPLHPYKGLAPANPRESSETIDPIDPAVPFHLLLLFDPVTLRDPVISRDPFTLGTLPVVASAPFDPTIPSTLVAPADPRASREPIVLFDSI
eukprot:6876253-Prymnesium_polylepis.1